MQSGHLKNKFFEFLSQKSSNAAKVLNTEIFDPAKSYYSLLAKLTCLETTVPVNELIVAEIKTNENSFLFTPTPKTNILKKNIVVIHNHNLSEMPKIKQKIEFLNINLPNIRYVLSLKKQVKWFRTNLKFDTVMRNYPVNLVEKVRIKSSAKIPVKIKIKKIGNDLINIDNKVRITEEITEILPYTKTLKLNKLYNLPVIRTPVSKSVFSGEQMNYFKEILANINKTKRTNIEIVTIFDRFNRELYSKIKPVANSSDLACYPNQKKINIDKDSYGFLLIGKRKDNNALVQGLAKLPNQNEAKII